MADVDTENLKETLKKLEDSVKQTSLNYDSILDMNVTVHAYLGETVMPLFEFIKIQKDYIIDLHKAAGESVALHINDRMFGKGDVMVYEKNLAIRVNEILDSKSIVSNYDSSI